MNWVWLAVESSTGRRTLVYDFAATASWPYRAIRAVLPDGLRPTGASVALLAAWAAVVIAMIVAGCRASDAPRSRSAGAETRRTGVRR